MKQIGAEIGVNESRVSQLHARAIRRLREALGEMGPQQVAEMRRRSSRSRAEKPAWRRPRCAAQAPASAGRTSQRPGSVVLPYKPRAAHGAGRRAATAADAPATVRGGAL